ncbi:MAG: PAS domain S-box protein [Xanthomonadaceae bacterium]|nr:PAS domain S-box protein [Xanthomonadaceae bacterium]
MLYAASKKDGGGYVHYWWKRPSTGIESPKIAYARGIPEWKIYIASGVYLDDIEAHIAGLKPALKRELQNYIQVSLLVTAGLIVLFLLSFHFVSRRLLNDFSLFFDFFKQAAHGDHEIDRDQVRFEELYQMAGDANKMLTDKIAAQGKLRQSEEKYRTFFENSSNAMLMIRGGKFIDCNDAVVEMFKSKSREDLLTKHPGELSPELQEDGRQSSEKAEEMMSIARAKGSHFFEWNHLRKNGEVFPVEVSLAAVTVGDEKLLHVILWDITERKQALGKLQESEKRFRDLADMLPEAIFEIDNNMKLTYANQRASELFGYTEEDFDHGLDSIDLLVPEDRERAREILARRLRGEKIGSVEYQALKKDGTSFPILHHMIAIIKDREIVGFRGVIVDLTERKQAEEEILKLRKLESLGVLAGGIAHDFNNLLTGLFGNIEMAKKFLAADHKSHKFLETAGRSMESATSLTTQMLTFAKGGDPIKETLSIGAMITETAQFSLRGSNTKLQTNIAPDLWPVEADKGQLSQVISNLVINAQQAMPDGGTITISAENVAKPAGRQVQITVEDEGIGISPQYLDRIFDPYFSTKQQGSGLGLASTHSIITKHNGTINTASILNEGTTFIICLPVAEKEEKTTPEDSLAETYSTPVVAAHILILDDEELVREVIGAMLEELGHKVSYAVHGSEAIKKYQEAWQNNSSYDAVITDLTIPGGMGGQEAAQRILKINPQAKIIVSSGYATDPVMANYKDYGFQGRVVKPYHFAELKKVIERVLMGT